jgi:hypothetical protein
MAAKSNNPTRPKSNQKIQLEDDTGSCPAARWARICDAAIKGNQAIEDRWANIRPMPYVPSSATCDDLQELAIDRASFLRPRSRLGALFLMHILYEHLEDLHAFSDDMEKNDVLGLARKAQRITLAVRDYIAAGDESAIEQACGGYFAPVRMGIEPDIQPILESLVL